MQELKGGRKRVDSVRAMELYRAGKTDAEVAETLGVSYTGAKQWRQRRKLPPNSDREFRRGISAEFKRLYAMGLTDQQIGTQLGVSRKNVQSWRWRNGLPCHRVSPEPPQPKEPRPRYQPAEKPAVLFMTDDEVLYSWHMAVDRKAQVKILAQLNACSVPQILEHLERLGVDVRPYQRRRQGKLDEEKAIAMWERGEDDDSIAKAMGISISSVKVWRAENGLYARAVQGGQKT